MLSHDLNNFAIKPDILRVFKIDQIVCTILPVLYSVFIKSCVQNERKEKCRRTGNALPFDLVQNSSRCDEDYLRCLWTCLDLSTFHAVNGSSSSRELNLSWGINYAAVDGKDLVTMS